MINTQPSIVKIDSLDNFTPIQNMVLVKPVRENDEITCKDGKTKLYLDITFNPAENANIIGQVIKIPTSLVFNRSNPNTMDWKTEIEIIKYDFVYYDCANAINAQRVECDGITYLMIPYQYFILARRADNIIMLNGYILVTPIEKEFKTKIIIPDTMKGDDDRKATVAYIGSCNERYLNKVYHDDPQVKVGDKIFMDSSCDIELEYDLHQTLDKKYFYVQRRNILAIL